MSAIALPSLQGQAARNSAAARVLAERAGGSALSSESGAAVARFQVPPSGPFHQSSVGVGVPGASQIGDQRAMLGHRGLVVQWNDQLPVVGVVVVLDARALDERGNLAGPLDLELSQNAPSTGAEDDVVL